MIRIEGRLSYGTSLGVAGSEGGGGKLISVGGFAVILSVLECWF
jgi:hypothetical protein